MSRASSGSHLTGSQVVYGIAVARHDDLDAAEDVPGALGRGYNTIVTRELLVGQDGLYELPCGAVRSRA